MYIYIYSVCVCVCVCVNAYMLVEMYCENPSLIIDLLFFVSFMGNVIKCDNKEFLQTSIYINKTADDCFSLFHETCVYAKIKTSKCFAN